MAKRRRNKGVQPRTLFSLLLVLALAGVIYFFSGDALGIFANAPERQPQAMATAPANATASAAKPDKSPIQAQGDAAQGELCVYVLDVGQGDSIFLKSPSGKTMLVDAGTSGSYKRIDAFLKEADVKTLDIVVATHPHADHIGAMADIIKNYEIGAFYMPDALATTKTFENMLDALEQKKVNVVEAAAGVAIDWDERVELNILSPFKGGGYDNLNDYSVMLHVRFLETAVLLTGDAEQAAEEFAMRELPSKNFRATVLKLGHHGSSTSTSPAFFDAVSPELAVLSLGEGNSYGHPHEETLRLLEQTNTPYYRTDESGHIHICMDGKDCRVETERMG